MKIIKYMRVRWTKACGQSIDPFKVESLNTFNTFMSYKCNALSNISIIISIIVHGK